MTDSAMGLNHGAAWERTSLSLGPAQDLFAASEDGVSIELKPSCLGHYPLRNGCKLAVRADAASRILKDDRR